MLMAFSDAPQNMSIVDRWVSEIDGCKTVDISKLACDRQAIHSGSEVNVRSSPIT